MKISIITPTFNASKDLPRAIDSVLAQSFTDWEHVVVDGGSSDGTLAILVKYGHLRWVSGKDGGIYDAMNKAIAMARGEWLIFLGADDTFYTPGVLEQVATELDDDFDVVYGDVNSTRFNGRYAGPFDADAIYAHNICHQSMFMRKSLFDRVGGFDLRFTGQADWDHNMKWLLDGRMRSKWIDLVVAEYADGGFSSTAGDPLFEKYKIELYLQRLLRGSGLKKALPFAREHFDTAWGYGDYRRVLRLLLILLRLVPRNWVPSSSLLSVRETL